MCMLWVGWSAIASRQNVIGQSANQASLVSVSLVVAGGFHGFVSLIQFASVSSPRRMRWFSLVSGSSESWNARFSDESVRLSRPSAPPPPHCHSQTNHDQALLRVVMTTENNGAQSDLQGESIHRVDQ